MVKSQKAIVVAVSGGFDPIHIGHVRLFTEAKKLGDKLIVILNNDKWLTDKKDKVFMKQTERKEIIEALKVVDKVILTSHKKGEYFRDKSVVRELAKIKPDIFANGGDRSAKNIPEYKICKKLGIKMVFNVGKGGKIQSSSWLVGKIRN